MRQIEDLGQRVLQQDTVHAGPERLGREQHPLRHLGRDRESDALEPAGLRQDAAHDADHFAVHIEHRATGIPHVDRRVRLEHFHRPATDDATHGESAADVTYREAVAEAVWCANHDDLVPYVELVGIAEPGGREGDRGPIEL